MHAPLWFMLVPVKIAFIESTFRIGRGMPDISPPVNYRQLSLLTEQRRAAEVSNRITLILLQFVNFPFYSQTDSTEQMP